MEVALLLKTENQLYMRNKIFSSEIEVIVIFNTEFLSTSVKLRVKDSKNHINLAECTLNRLARII